MDFKNITDLIKEREELLELQENINQTSCIKLSYMKNDYSYTKAYPKNIENRVRKALKTILQEEIKNCEEQIKKLCHEQ